LAVAGLRVVVVSCCAGPIDQVIADWQKTLTASASTVAASAMGGGSPDSPAPSPLFGPNETHTKKKKDDKQHPKNKREGDPLICLSVPSDDCTGYAATHFYFILNNMLFLFAVRGYVVDLLVLFFFIIIAPPKVATFLNELESNQFIFTRQPLHRQTDKRNNLIDQIK
jgi:hypothetical protein